MYYASGQIRPKVDLANTSSGLRPCVVEMWWENYRRSMYVVEEKVLYCVVLRVQKVDY